MSRKFLDFLRLGLLDSNSALRTTCGHHRLISVCQCLLPFLAPSPATPVSCFTKICAFAAQYEVGGEFSQWLQLMESFKYKGT